LIYTQNIYSFYSGYLRISIIKTFDFAVCLLLKYEKIRKMKLIITVLLVLISVTGFTQGNKNTEKGSEALDFTLKTIDGEEITLSKLYKEQPVVLVILRGWPGYQCPVCTKQVGALVAEEYRFADRKASVLMVYPGPSDDLQEHAEEFSEDFRFPANFYFALDPDYSMINLYELRWDAPKETAYPSTFVINREGIIVFSKISATHGGRASNEEIFEALNTMKN